MPTLSWQQWARLVFAIFLAVYGVSMALNPGNYTFLDQVDLVFHEAGHWVFRFLGTFMTVLGGTLMQLLIPAVLAAYFFLRRSWYAASVLLFWLGQSFFNVSVYARDARAQVLPLLGGPGAHDWTWILSQTGMLARDQQVGDILFGVGLAILILSLLGSFWFALRDRPPWQKSPPAKPPKEMVTLFPEEGNI